MLLRDPYSVDAGFPVNRDCALNRGLVAWYLGLPQFGGGTTWRDLVRANHGALTNMDPSSSWVPSRAQGGWLAADFDGTDDYVDCGDNALFEFDDDFTVLCRFSSSAARTYQAMVTKWTGLGSGSQWWIGHLSNKVQAGIYTTDGGVDLLDSGAAYKDGAWHQVALTRKGNEAYLYVDAEMRAGKIVGVNIVGWNAAALNFGTKNNSGTWPYEGQLDDIRIFHRALSAGEIGELEEDSLSYYPKTLNRLRRWLPAPVATTLVGPPYRIAAGLTFVAGQVAGQHFTAGGVAGDVLVPSAETGQVAITD